MFDLKVVGLIEANELVLQHWPTHIISLTSDCTVDYDVGWLAAQPPQHLHIQVNDVSFATQYTICPSPEHLRTVLTFTEHLLPEDRLLVHCFAGQSRSTAMAIGILIQHGMTSQEAFAHVAAIRDILLPNALFIRHIDDYFDLEGQLVQHVTEHRKSKQRKSLPAVPPTEEEMKRLLEIFKL